MPRPLVALDLADSSWVDDKWHASGIAPPIADDPDPAYAGRKVCVAYLNADLNMNGGTSGGTHQYRSEIVPNKSAGENQHAYPYFNFGDHNLIGMRIRLAGNYATRDGREEIFVQWHLQQTGGGKPCVVLKAAEGQMASDGPLALSVKGNQNYGATTFTSNQQVNLKKPDGSDWLISEWLDRWITIVFDIVWSYDTDGRVIVYVDGHQAANIRGRNCNNYDLGPYLKTGVYKSSWNFLLNDGDQDPNEPQKRIANGVRTRLHYFADVILGDVASGHTIDDVTPAGPTVEEPEPPADDDPGPNPGSVLVQSSFTAANGTAITAVIPGTDVVGGGLLGTAQIQSNALAFTANGQYAAIDCGSRNHRIRVKWTANGADNRSQLILRASQGDASLPATGYAITLRTGLNQIQLAVIDAGVSNLLVVQNYELDQGATYEAIAEIWDARLRLWLVNATSTRLLFDQIHTQHVDGDFVQLRHVTYNSTGGRFDDLSVYGTAPALQAVIKTQRLTAGIEQNLLTAAITAGFEPVADLSKALLRIAGPGGMAMGHGAGLSSASGQPFKETLMRADFNGANRIDLTRQDFGANNFTSECELEIVESLLTGTDGFSVLQRGTVTIAGGVLTAETATIPGVTDASRIWVRVTGCTYDGNGNSQRNIWVTAEFSAGKAVFTRGNTASGLTVAYEVVQLGANWSVQVISHALNVAGSVQTATVSPSVDWTKTIPYLTARCSDANDEHNEIHCWPGSNGSSLKLYVPIGTTTVVRVWLISHASLSAQHANSIDGAALDLPSGAGLQTVTRDLASATNAGRTLMSATLGNRFAGTRSPATNWQWRLLDSGTQVRFKRARGESSSAVAYSLAAMADIPATPPPPEPPTPPGSPYVIVLSDTSATLGWDPSFSAVGLQSYGYALNGGAIVWTGSTALSAAISGLSTYTEYEAVFYARDTNLDASGPSESITFRTLDSTVPAAPVNNMATGTTVDSIRIDSDGTPTNPPSGISHYLIEVDGIMRDDEIGGFPYYISGFEPASEHDFVLYAMTGDGVLSAGSEQFIGTTLPPGGGAGGGESRSRTVSLQMVRVNRVAVKHIGSQRIKANLALFGARSDGILSKQLLRGVGTTTFSRDSIAFGIDYDGNYQPVAANVLRWQGARYEGDQQYSVLPDGTPLHPVVLADGVLVLQEYASWAASTTYPAGQRIIPASGSGTAGGNGYWYECTVAGTAQASEPAWPTTIDATITDGGVTWRCGGYYRIGGALIEGTVATNFLHNADTPATQTQSLPAGDYVLWVAGTGDCTLSGGPTGSAAEGSPVTFTLADTTAVTFTVTGDLDRFQCENGDIPTSFIITGAGPVTRDADTLTFPKAGNLSDASSVLVADFRPANWSAPAGYIVGDAAGYVLKPAAANGGAAAYDGVNTAVGPTGTPTGTIRAATTWAGNQMNIVINGVAGAEVDYAGSFNLAADVPVGNGYHGTIRNLRIFSSLAGSSGSSTPPPAEEDSYGSLLALGVI